MRRCSGLTDTTTTYTMVSLHVLVRSILSVAESTRIYLLLVQMFKPNIITRMPTSSYCRRLLLQISRGEDISHTEIAYNAIRNDDIEMIESIETHDPAILSRTHFYSVTSKEDYKTAEQIRGILEERGTYTNT